MTRVVVVLNPRAGGGRTDRLWEELRAGTPELAAAHIVRSPDPEAARGELAAVLDSAVERVLVVGGDGSAHLVGNLLLELGLGDQVAIGLIPTGTGSDLARALGIPAKPRAALARVLSAEPRPIDVLRVHTDDGRQRFVLNVASAGVSGLVDQAVNAMPRRGAMAYLVATLGALSRYRPIPCRVLVDGALWHEEKILLVAVANGETFGNGMRIAPGARLDDAEADVVLIGAVPRWQLPFRLPQIYFGTHLHTRYVRAGRGQRVRLEPLAPLPPFDLDGEVFDSAPCDITVLPGALRFLF